MSLDVVLVVDVLVAVLVVARVVAVVLVVVLAVALVVVLGVVLVAVLVLCVVFYRERNGSTIYVKKNPTVVFLVKEIAKLERERSVFCPGLFREEGWATNTPGAAIEKEPLSRKLVWGIIPASTPKQKEENSKG